MQCALLKPIVIRKLMSMEQYRYVHSVMLLEWIADDKLLTLQKKNMNSLTSLSKTNKNTFYFIVCLPRIMDLRTIFLWYSIKSNFKQKISTSVKLRENCRYSELFWSAFSRIRTRITPDSDSFYAVTVKGKSRFIKRISCLNTLFEKTWILSVKKKFPENYDPIRL